MGANMGILPRTEEFSGGVVGECVSVDAAESVCVGVRERGDGQVPADEFGLRLVVVPRRVREAVRLRAVHAASLRVGEDRE